MSYRPYSLRAGTQGRVHIPSRNMGSGTQRDHGQAWVKDGGMKKKIRFKGTQR